MKSILLSLGLTLLVGCASVPEPLRGEFTDVEPDAAIGATGQVRWGGRIVEVMPMPDTTCIEILGMPLDVRARPLDLDHGTGRFRACKGGFLDPAIFATGRDITVTGSVVGEETRELGEYSYRMPRIAIDEVLLWPERPRIEHVRVHDDPFAWRRGWWPVGPVFIYRSRLTPR